MARLEATQVQLRTCVLQCTDTVSMYEIAVKTLVFVIRRFFMPFLFIPWISLKIKTPRTLDWKSLLNFARCKSEQHLAFPKLCTCFKPMIK